MIKPFQSLAFKWQLTLGVTIAVLLASLMTYVLWQRDPTIVKEHRLIETLQAGFLLLAGWLHLYQGNRLPESLGRGIHRGLSLFCLSLFLREVDINAIVKNELMNYFEMGTRIILALAWIVYAYQMRGQIDAIKANWRRICETPAIICTVIGCLFYVLSRPFDKKQFPWSREVLALFEEMTQLDAALLLLAGAMVLIRIAGQSAIESSKVEAGEAGDESGSMDERS